MARNIEKLAKKMGAEIVGQVPDVGGGAFGAARLREILRKRLEPSAGRRFGRPTDPSWDRRPKVPMSTRTETQLVELASLVSGPGRKVSPMQVAAQLLEEAVERYFRQRPEKGRARV
ncbi:MAG: hypothetical protein GY953_11685 [bacterium]|nr:hypothetical protein [bacterium]